VPELSIVLPSKMKKINLELGIEHGKRSVDRTPGENPPLGDLKT
jgi:hypothetical protein